MLKYLLSFDEAELPEIPDELDISDRSILQAQINECRKSHMQLIRMYDKFKGDRLEYSHRAAEIKRDINSEYSSRTDRVSELENNLEYQKCLANMDALDIALETLKFQLEFVKQDMRILTNSMYNKN